MINGMRVTTSLFLTQNGTHYPVRRTWRERLFSRPWRPFQKTRMVTPQIPYQGYFQFGNTILMHPEMFHKMKNLVDMPNFLRKS